MFQKTLIDCIDKVYDEQTKKNEWKNSKFWKINELKADNSGKVGELFLSNLCKILNISHEYDEDKNSKDGTYDIKFNNKMIEIKTARKSCKTYNFQHESLHENSIYDYYGFLDIYPTGEIIFSLLKKEEMRWKNKIPEINRKPHLRKNTEDVYKLDFDDSTHKRLLKINLAINLSESTEEELKIFLKLRNLLD